MNLGGMALISELMKELKSRKEFGKYYYLIFRPFMIENNHRIRTFTKEEWDIVQDLYMFWVGKN